MTKLSNLLLLSVSINLSSLLGDIQVINALADDVAMRGDQSRTSSAVGEGLESKRDDSANASPNIDPFEEWNRGVFWFNDQVDWLLLEPLAQGYDFVVPDVMQTGVRNFFENLRSPVNLLSNVLTLELSQAGIDTLRFTINSTVGLGGLIDWAADWGLEHKHSDFGITLGRWGIGNGPYLVLPLLGPSCLRDAVGKAGDSVAHPLFYLRYSDLGQAEQNTISFTARGLDLVQTRADLLDVLKTAKDGSLDFYAFVRSSYFQRRKGLISGAELGFEDEEQPSLEE